MLFSFIPGTLKRNSSISGKPVMTGRALAASVVEDHCPDLWTTTSISLLTLSSCANVSSLKIDTNVQTEPRKPTPSQRFMDPYLET